MIDALLTGRLYGKAEARTSRAGKTFAVAKVRTPHKAGEFLYVSVVSFVPITIRTLLELDPGDAVALSGELTADTYTDADGRVWPALSLNAHSVVSEHHTSRKRAAIRDARHAEEKASG